MSPPTSFLIFALASCICLFSCVQLTNGDCGIGSIDLTSIAYDHTYTDKDDTLWIVKPCGPTVLDTQCLSSDGPTSSACGDHIAYGRWDTELWHKWSFINPDNPAAGVQLYMEGVTAPDSCNFLDAYYSWILFPCSTTQQNLTVVANTDCSANFTIPTPLTCHNPLEQRITLTEN